MKADSTNRTHEEAAYIANSGGTLFTLLYLDESTGRKMEWRDAKLFFCYRTNKRKGKVRACDDPSRSLCLRF